MKTPLDETLLTLTLPAYQWGALRGAARRAAAHDFHRSRTRDRPLPGKDLDAHRAEALARAADAIDAALRGE